MAVGKEAVRLAEKETNTLLPNQIRNKLAEIVEWSYKEGRKDGINMILNKINEWKNA